MQTDRQTEQDWVGPDLPSLSGVVFGSILFVTGWMLIMTVIGAPIGILLFGAGLGWMLTPKARAVVAAVDPLFVRRLLELHRERLGEWLEEQRRLVASIERSLVEEPGWPPRAGSEDVAERRLELENSQIANT